MSGAVAPDLDTAMVLGMASTALPFADSREAEAERWLRILRMYGDAGTALQALGVSEAPMEELAPAHEQPPGPPPSRDVIADVSAAASEVASTRGARAVASGDVLVAVMDVYGDDFDRVLRVHGTDRQEVLERLATERPEEPTAA